MRELSLGGGQRSFGPVVGLAGRQPAALCPAVGGAGERREPQEQAENSPEELV